MREREFAISVPPEARYLQVVRGFFRPVVEECVGEKEAAGVILALDESCSNVVKYRAHDRIVALHVRAVVGPGRVVFRIGHYCQSGDLPNIKPRDAEDTRPGGRGWIIIGQVMDRVTFEPDVMHPGFVNLVLEKTVQPGEVEHDTQN